MEEIKNVVIVEQVLEKWDDSMKKHFLKSLDLQNSYARFERNVFESKPVSTGVNFSIENLPEKSNLWLRKDMNWLLNWDFIDIIFQNFQKILMPGSKKVFFLVKTVSSCVMFAIETLMEEMTSFREKSIIKAILDCWIIRIQMHRWKSLISQSNSPLHFWGLRFWLWWSHSSQ